METVPLALVITEEAMPNESAATADNRQMTTASNGKRLKLSPQQLTIYDLPDAALTHISKYLHPVSKMLLAAALTASPRAWRKANWKIQPSEAGQVIVSDYVKIWKSHTAVLFSRDEDGLAAKLSDEDVGGVLACLGAFCNIDWVKLTNCIRITGRGLEPLRGSAFIEMIDLGLVKDYQSPTINPEPMISEEAVLPILESILDAEGVSLKYVHFPKKWRVGRSHIFDVFLGKYNHAMNGRALACSAKGWEGQGADIKRSQRLCNATCYHEPLRSWSWVNRQGEQFGVHNFTCSSCYNHFCVECGDEHIPHSHFCRECQLKFCRDCAQVLTCDLCDETTCDGCSGISTCSQCLMSTCGDCRLVNWCDDRHCNQSRCVDCMPFVCCEYENCDKSNCMDCSSSDSQNVDFCLECNNSYCAEHLLAKNQDPIKYDFCSGCSERAEEITGGLTAL